MRYRPRSSAAYRWGLWEAVGTATASVILLWLESVAIHLGFLGSVEASSSATDGLSWESMWSVSDA